jgi:hypothetical protein
MFIRLKDDDARDIAARVLKEIYIYDNSEEVIPALTILMGDEWVKDMVDEYEHDGFYVDDEDHVHPM